MKAVQRPRGPTLTVLAAAVPALRSLPFVALVVTCTGLWSSWLVACTHFPGGEFE